ncbi:hypothetical protein GCM10022226_40870 [Sphaerisporangium flaviroseum]|uniref:Uncharacterized protein n=1 Tax=Sphaerisporangium flaviroseum TaxID=509199 RepID=A0ABP7IDT3_9ACTN
MRQRLVTGPLYAVDHLPHGRIALEPGPDDDRVGQRADEARGVRPVPVRRQEAQADVAPPGQPGQQHGKPREYRTPRGPRAGDPLEPVDQGGGQHRSTGPRAVGRPSRLPHGRRAGR